MATVTAQPAQADFYNSRIKALAATARQTGLPDRDALLGGAERRRASIDNPLCGDQIEVEIWSRNGRIIELGFDIRGCLLAEASAAVMRQLAIGQTYAELDQRIEQLEAFLDGEQPLPPAWATALDCFTPVQAHPGRHDCLLLPFLAIQMARAAET